MATLGVGCSNKAAGFSHHAPSCPGLAFILLLFLTKVMGSGQPVAILCYSAPSTCSWTVLWGRVPLLFISLHTLRLEERKGDFSGLLL